MRWLVEAVLQWQVKECAEAQAELLHCYQDSRRQRQQAQKERDRQKQFALEQVDMATKLMFEAAGLRVKLDAAIKRGVQAYRFLEGYANNSLQLLRAIEGQAARAEAAERDAAEQRALAEAKDALIQEGLNALDSYQVTSKFDEALALTPAEAPRAKHRSPQSGQKEGDGD